MFVLVALVFLVVLDVVVDDVVVLVVCVVLVALVFLVVLDVGTLPKNPWGFEHRGTTINSSIVYMAKALSLNNGGCNNRTYDDMYGNGHSLRTPRNFNKSPHLEPDTIISL